MHIMLLFVILIVAWEGVYSLSCYECESDNEDTDAAEACLNGKTENMKTCEADDDKVCVKYTGFDVHNKTFVYRYCDYIDATGNRNQCASPPDTKRVRSYTYCVCDEENCNQGVRGWASIGTCLLSAVITAVLANQL